MIKKEMDFELHLISFGHGAVVNKHVAQPSALKGQPKLKGKNVRDKITLLCCGLSQVLHFKFWKQSCF